MIAAGRETVVTQDDDDDMVHIWTCQRKVITALSEKADPHETGTHVDGTRWASFLIPVTRYDVSGGIEAARNLSEAQRAALAERLQAGRRGSDE